MKTRLLLALLVGAAVLPNLQGCFPVVAAGVTTGVVAAVDRRSLGAQTEDEEIEWKAASRIKAKLGDKGHVNVTSYNRRLLLTGEVGNEAARAEAEQAAGAVPNVAGVTNELTIGPVSSLTDRSNDSYVTTKVKTRSLDSGKFNVIHVKVVTEAGVVYLLGMVTQAEADAAIQVARTTGGVRKVVNLFEIISSDKARELDISGGSQNKAAPAQSPRP